MNVFFGKISTKNKKQVEEHCYYAPKDHPVFQGLDKGDYVFMLCNGKVHLWQADDYVEDEDGVNGKRLFNVIFENIGKKSFFLSHIKYFKLSLNNNHILHQVNYNELSLLLFREELNKHQQ